MLTPTKSETLKDSTDYSKLNKKILRRAIRQKRQNLSALSQKRASLELLRHIKRSQVLLKHRYIALYLGNDGELNPEILIKPLFAYKKQVYLPVMHPIANNKLCFSQITPATRFKKNRFNILEPVFKPKNCLRQQFLSLVFMPLVAFDHRGNRMGMGGGFYDRSFAYKLKKQRDRPALMGVAHAFQQQESLPVEPWDVPLDGIFTDKQFYTFS